MMSWLYLIIAGLFEIAWPFSLNPSQMLGHLALGVIIVMVCMAAMRGVPVAGPARYLHRHHLYGMDQDWRGRHLRDGRPVL